jgi:aspartyl-tRNA(Asn)/glutamyl-tRNA(Gln) amidotransferase subunit A
MTSLADPADLSLTEQARALAEGRTTARALVEASLERIARIDGDLGSFAHFDAAGSRAAADRADADHRTGRSWGPLHGLPLAVKDNCLTADMPTRAGTAAPGIAFPARDATVVARLRRAGAILLGKTAMHEFAWGIVTPQTRNPWDPARVAGGSSGGSAAAVAAGLVAGAIGTDTGGSIRIPASLCGIVGLKPTFGRVGRGGVVPHSWSLDHVGPMTRTVADAALLLSVLSGVDPDDPASVALPPPELHAEGGIAGLRLGVCRNHFFGRNAPDVEAAVERAIDWYAAHGARVVEFRLPLLDHGLGAIFAIELASSAAYHGPHLRDGTTEGFAPDVRLLVEMGELVTGPDYLRAEQVRRLLMEAFRAVFAEVDVIIGPTTPLTAWRPEDRDVTVGGAAEGVLAAGWRLTYPWNLTGAPAVSLPCGFDRHGLPIGLQLAAAPFAELVLLRAARAFEAAHDYAGRRPPQA